MPQCFIVKLETFLCYGQFFNPYLEVWIHIPHQESPTEFHYFQKVSYVLCNRLYMQGRTLPSAFDNTFDTVISMITNKLLTGHPDFLRYRGTCMPCCFSSTPQKLKSRKNKEKVKTANQAGAFFWTLQIKEWTSQEAYHNLFLCPILYV